MPTWTIHQGDALAILPALTGPADLVIADPPYNSGGRTASERTSMDTRTKYVSSGSARKGAQHDLAGFAGDNRDQRAFTVWLAMVLTGALRLAAPGSSALVFTDWRQLPATSDALQAAGWTWRGVVPWHKPTSRPRPDGFRPACEYVLWGTNGQPYRHAPTVYLPGLVSGSQPRGHGRRHITQKPVDVLRQLVQVCRPAGTVLDPFAGAGSAGVAALAEDRSYIGIELTEHYADIARQRLAEWQATGAD